MFRRILNGRILLKFLAVILMISAAIRISDEAGNTMALQAKANLPGAAPALECPTPPIRIIEALNIRENAISQKEARLNDHAAAIELAQKAIDARLDELTMAEEKLRKTLSIANGAAEKDLERLTAVYEAMKPADSSKLFQEMAPEFASGFLGRMKPEAAAAIMAGMGPENAYSISVLLAGRNAKAPKE